MAVAADWRCPSVTPASCCLRGNVICCVPVCCCKPVCCCVPACSCSGCGKGGCGSCGGSKGGCGSCGGSKGSCGSCGGCKGSCGSSCCQSSCCQPCCCQYSCCKPCAPQPRSPGAVASNTLKEKRDLLVHILEPLPPRELHPHVPGPALVPPSLASPDWTRRQLWGDGAAHPRLHPATSAPEKKGGATGSFQVGAIRTPEHTTQHLRAARDAWQLGRLQHCPFRS
ncbi:PREDICTED: keratin-associated protein 5-3-like [Propithecus coquereli]|uniref:keratin-associated protein 5-3-like n=1 Tax=Propithecus coquereli TaxID=379532 RepID=UPI00063F6566|nr:PREDICTED: keratin-associated protein 5-3-like [Propithecus coquereli]